MSTTYEQTTVTQTTASSSGGGIRPDVFYVKSIPGILKIVEMVLSLIVLICASIYRWWLPYGGAWVQFVASMAFIVTIILFIFHFMHIFEKLPGPWMLIEFIFYIVITIMWLIAAIVSAARAGTFSFEGSIAATAFFAFAATAVYAVDTFFMFRGWQGSTTTTSSTTTAGGATTTTTQYETRTQY